MNDHPAISIIVPVHNNDKHIEKCLDSILNQSFTNFEVIVVNDGSTDHSAKLCEEAARKDKRIRVIHQTSQGVSAARNAGLKKTTGDYIGFVDGDDYIVRDMYRELYQACVDAKSNISICKLGRKIEGKLVNKSTVEYTLELSNEEALDELFKGLLYRFSLCNKLFNKRCLEGISFPCGRIHEDLSTTYRIFANANKVVYVNFIGYIYVKQEDSILTKSYYEKRLDAFIGWDEILAFMQIEYPRLLDRVNACFTYNCMDHIYDISSSPVLARTKKMKYLKVIQSYIRKNYLNLIRNKSLPIKIKTLTILFSFNVPLFIFVQYIKKLKSKSQVLKGNTFV